MNKYVKLTSILLASLLSLTACFTYEKSEEAAEEEAPKITTTDEGECPVHPVLGLQSYVEAHRFTFDAPSKNLCMIRYGVTDTDLTFDQKVIAAKDRCVSGTANTSYPRWIAYSAGNATAPQEASAKCVYLFEEPAALYLDQVDIPTDPLDRARAEYQEYVDTILTREGYEWSTASRELTKELQTVLGISADGWYGNDTRAAHLAALEERPDLVHPPLPTADN